MKKIKEMNLYKSLKDSATFNIQEVNKDEAEKGMEKVNIMQQ